MEALPRMRCAGARPKLPIFWNLTPKNIPDQQKPVRIQKSKKSAKLLHPNVQVWENTGKDRNLKKKGGEI